MTGADFSGAKLTGICIEDWNVNSQTLFTNVQCDFVYRKLDEKGERTERFPANRNFEPREFESLYQEVGNVVQLIFKEGVNWRAFSFALQKLQVDDESLGIELKGIEKRGDLWVVKVSHNENVTPQVVEQNIYAAYEELQKQLASKEQQINQLLGIVTDQAAALKGYSRQAFGNSFFIMGSTITNLAGFGTIDYDEASSSIRSIVANSGDSTHAASVVQNLLEKFQRQSVATSIEQQVELIQQIILAEAKKDPFFKQVFIQQARQIADTLANSAIANAVRSALAQLKE